MYFVDNGSAVPVMPQVKPVSSATPQFFTEGGNGTPPTYPGPDWFNIFQLELLNVLKEAQINPDKANHTQLVTAMKKLFLDASSNGSDIPDKAAFLSNLQLSDVIHGDACGIAGFNVQNPDIPYMLHKPTNTVVNLAVESSVASRLSGKLSSNNNLSEISQAGAPAQSAARLNLGNVPTKGEVYLSANNLSELASAGATAQAAARLNIGAKSAATRDIGTGSNQVPDMGAFQSDLRQTGVQRLPGGYVRQWGVGTPDASGNLPTSFPVAFSSRPFGVYFGYRQSSLPTSVQSIVIDDSSLTNAGFNGRAYMIDGSGALTASPNAFFWVAEGKI